MTKDDCLSDAGCVGDLASGYAVEAMLREHLGGDFEDLLLPVWRREPGHAQLPPIVCQFAPAKSGHGKAGGAPICRLHLQLSCISAGSARSSTLLRRPLAAMSHFPI